MEDGDEPLRLCSLRAILADDASEHQSDQRNGEKGEGTRYDDGDQRTGECADTRKALIGSSDNHEIMQ